MGRTLVAILFLGLLAGAGWFAYGKFSGGPEPASPTASAAAAEEEGIPGRVAAGGAPASALSGAADVAPAAEAKAGEADAAPDAAPSAAGVRTLLREGRRREAVAKAAALPAATLRDPACAAVAREAALALAGSPAAGAEERLVRADEARRLLGRLAVEEAVPLASVRERLDALNREVLFAGREVPGSLFRGTVKPGDTLDRLLRKEWSGRVKAGYGVILWLNSIPSADRLRVGGIWVSEEPVRLVVRKGAHELWVLLGGVPVRTYPVGLGMGGRTPEGEFEIVEMLQRPDYWPPQGRRIPFGQPGNPLGTRWMGFRDTPEAQGFGIHGTDDPSSVGKDESQGCVRLRNEDVEQLFTWVTAGTRVEIRR
jgi:hypothetical protein